MQMRFNNIDVIGCQLDMGAPKHGVSMGPLAIRYGGLIEGLSSLGYNVTDKGDVLPPTTGKSLENMRFYEQVISANKELHKRVFESLSCGNFPVVLGGDHSIAAGSCSAVSNFYKDKGGIGVIWIDAHGDWNDEHTTPSGNMHGMPFSALCGYGPDMLVSYDEKPNFVNVKNAVVIGARDIDREEGIRMREAGVNVFPINVIDKMGMDAVIKEAIKIASKGTAGIHLSFDIDSITPEAAPGTGTIVPAGLTPREAYLALETLAESRKLLSMDMVEVNPILDNHNMTGILAARLIQSALGEIVY